MALLEIENLSFTYRGAKEPALTDIQLSVESGDFVLIIGESGCGKTTLLKLLKKQLVPNGERTGSVRYRGVDVARMDERAAAAEIGFVMQNPDNQTVTDKVWHELAFGLESLGEATDVIRRKVAEICGFFGMGAWYHQKTCELSGGQKQLLALASVLVMNPSVLILDEPTARLDPIAASEFLAALKKIHDELGVTILIAEHRLEEVFPLASKVVLMDRATLCMVDTPRGVGQRLASGAHVHKLVAGLPAAVRLFHALNGEGECPLTVREGKRYLMEHYGDAVRRLSVEKRAVPAEKALEISGGYFRYERQLPDVLAGLDLTVYRGELLCILGANGAGKTTLLRVLSGTRRLYKGKLRIWGKKIKEYTTNTLYRGNVACLNQDPQTLFVKSTVRADLLEATRVFGYPKGEGEKAVEAVMEQTGVRQVADAHPYDLSGGEQQKAALAKLLLMQPKILLLDEPTKGLDACSKGEFAALLAGLRAEGKTVVLVTHDVEFAAEYADRCAMFFDGQIVSIADRVEFFATNAFYTTAAARMTRPRYENAVTVADAVQLCRLNAQGGEQDDETRGR